MHRRQECRPAVAYLREFVQHGPVARVLDPLCRMSKFMFRVLFLPQIRLRRNGTGLTLTNMVFVADIATYCNRIPRNKNHRKEIIRTIGPPASAFIPTKLVVH